MNYFGNDTEAVTVGGLTLENGIGEVLIHGADTIRRDGDSLFRIRAFIQRLTEIESALMRDLDGDGPASTEIVPPAVVDNPFA